MTLQRLKGLTWPLDEAKGWKRLRGEGTPVWNPQRSQVERVNQNAVLCSLSEEARDYRILEES